MKKIILTFLLFVGSLFVFTNQVFAYETFSTKVDDKANLFTPEQKTQLEEKIKEVEETSKSAIAIVTITENDRGSSRTYADYYILDNLGKDKNATILLIDMERRKIIIDASGDMIDILSDGRKKNIIDKISPLLANQNYYSGAQIFLDDTEQYVKDGVEKGHFRIDEETGEITRTKVKTPVSITIFGSIIASLTATFGAIFTTRSRYKVKKVPYKYDWQNNYKLKLNTSNDSLINTSITTRIIHRDDSNNFTGGGSSGVGSTTHSTGGGTFSSGEGSF
ncbi:TPM domain-containing protein [Floricoccus penangensis]|uniref:TPM domain-containing protein n=1 Tax=Floricoccus penangensis TaxID=1859475 RepID=UPI00203C882C|nr:TPM domain-containing protein [Floricoccus penangensis]URZ86855.1 TPM domain-containing protein [Floricoccus penangensis]